MKSSTRRATLTASLCLLLGSSCAVELDPDEARGDAGVSELADKASSTTYQAEGHSFQSSCQKSTAHPGYTGTGFMDFGGKGSLLEWNNVNVAVAGQHTLTFRYANGSSGARQAAVTINDASPAGNVAFGSTGGWSAWSEISLQATLKAGTNKIRITANTDAGGPNLDAMVVTSSAVPEARCATANEGTSATLACASGQVIAAVSFASYGDFTASCPSLSKGTCHAASAQSKVEAQCLNKPSCVVPVNNASFGDPCAGVPKRLGVTYTCKSASTPPPPPTVMPVFLLAGQSNMEGNTDRALHDGLMSDLASGTAQTQEQRLRDRLTSWYQTWSNGYAMYGYSAGRVALEASELVRLNRAGLVSASLSQPDPKVLCAWNGAPQPLALNCGSPYGPELTLGRVLTTTVHSPTSLIKVAKGGTSLSADWLSTSAARRTGRAVGSLYTTLSARIKSLRASPASVHPSCTSQACRWAAFVWFQGENDTFDQAHAQAYEQNLRDLLADVRAEIGVATLPVIVVKIGAWAQSMPHGATVARAQNAVVAADPHARLVTTEDLSGFYHYDPAAQLIIGERVASALKAMLNGGPPPPPPPPPPSSDQKCAEVTEGSAAALSCPSAQVIRSIAFASYGTPAGACPKFSTNACHAPTSKSKVEAACLNKASCRVDANNGVFGDPCTGAAKRLVVSYSCGDAGGGGGTGAEADKQTLQYYGSVAPSSLGPAPTHTLVDTNRNFFGGTDGISHEPTAAQGAGKFIFNRIYRASKHGVGYGEQYGIYHWWLGSYGSNSIEGGIWVNPYVAGPHYYPTLHIAGVGDPYHTCTDVQFGSGMGSAFIGDRWLAMIQISNRVLTVPGVNIAFDKDQPPYEEDNGMWLGWGWTYLNLAHPRGYKYWMSFIESHDYQGPINGYVPEFFNWVDPKRIQDGSYQEKRRTMSPFGTFATIGSKPDASVANEQYTRGFHVRDDIYYVPVPRMPSYKAREYVVAHAQGIESQAMEAYSNALRSNASFDTLIKTQFKRFNGTFSSTHSQFKVEETIGGQQHLTVVRPSYSTGYEGYKGFIEWSNLSAASQNGYQYVRKLSSRWPVESGASDEYKNHPNLYTSVPIAPPDNVQRVPRVGLKFFSYKERNTAHPDFANWNTSGKTRYTVKLQNGSTATYVWFKFIDQPAFKTARQNWPQVYTESYLQQLQTYIDSLHRRVRERSKVNPSDPVFINYRNPSDPSRFDPHLVRLDPGQLVVPPAGFEIGYVPVIISVVHPSEYSDNGSGGRNEAPDASCTNARWTNTYHPDIP